MTTVKRISVGNYWTLGAHVFTRENQLRWYVLDHRRALRYEGTSLRGAIAEWRDHRRRQTELAL